LRGNSGKRRKLDSGAGEEEDETKKEEMADPDYDGRMDAWMRGDYDSAGPMLKTENGDDDEEPEDDAMEEGVDDQVDELVSCYF
jgi:hypothetical protein